jgi:hypothetical protein
MMGIYFGLAIILLIGLFVSIVGFYGIKKQNDSKKKVAMC